MVRIWTTLASAALIFGQTPPRAPVPEMPSGFVRGAMAAWDGTANAGQITVRAADGTLSSCGYDYRSWFDRAHERIAVSKLIAGDPLEVLADRKPGQRNCYVRIVHVLDPIPASRARRVAAVKPPQPPLPRGDRTISGAVIRRDGSTLYLKTREGESAVQLRADTAYYGDGIRLDASALAINTRVFLRAGRNLDGEIEAYRVMWGQIVEPTQ